MKFNQSIDLQYLDRMLSPASEIDRTRNKGTKLFDNERDISKILRKCLRQTDETLIFFRAGTTIHVGRLLHHTALKRWDELQIEVTEREAIDTLNTRFSYTFFFENDSVIFFRSKMKWIHQNITAVVIPHRIVCMA